jgi:hypothetical protein
MLNNETPVARFFRHYQQLNSINDATGMAALFADTFMAASPQGAQCVLREDFARALPKRIELFQSLGCESTSLVSFSETKLDERFAMAETKWRMVFRKDGEAAREAVADSLYIFDMEGDAPKVVFYLAHRDFMEILRQHGFKTS